MQRISTLGRALHCPATHSPVISRPTIAPGVQLHRPVGLRCSAAEVSTPATVADAETQAPKVLQPAGSTKPQNNTKKDQQFRTPPNGQGRKGSSGKDSRGASNAQSGGDRAIIQQRCRLLMEGEAVGLAMAPTPEDLAVGFKGLRPLSQELRRRDRTLLFFASNQKAPEASADEPSSPDAPRQRTDRRQEQPQQQQMLELALVAVPRFTPPQPEVIIRVGARSDAATISRILTRAAVRSGAVALRAAGPAAALVALRAAVLSRRALAAERQLDLAFSIEYLRLPAYEASNVDTAEVMQDGKTVSELQPSEPLEAGTSPAADTAATTTAAAAAEKEKEEEEEDGQEAAAAAAAAAAAGGRVTKSFASILQFSFYKRELPTPQVVVADFAPERASSALVELLTSLLGERREVEVVVGSREVLFAMQAVARVVRKSWARYSASVAAFLVAMEPEGGQQQAKQERQGSGSHRHRHNRYNRTSRNTSSSSSSRDHDSNSSSGRDAYPEYTARLVLRRLAGAPNLVPTRDSNSFSSNYNNFNYRAYYNRSGSGSGSGRGGEVEEEEEEQPQTLLGAPLGFVKADSPLGPLTAAMNREFDAVGWYSVLPSDGNCTARALWALWEAQQQRAAAKEEAAAAAAGAAANDTEASAEGDTAAAASPASEEAAATAGATTADADATGATAATAATATPAAPTVEIAIVPEFQPVSDRPTGPSWATVLHLLELSPLLFRTLRIREQMLWQDGRREELLQITKAVLLRNKMHGNRKGGKLLVMTPRLDPQGALQLQLEYVESALVGGLPEPPRREGAGPDSKSAPDPDNGSSRYGSRNSGRGSEGGRSAAEWRGSSSSSSRREASEADDAFAGYATDDEYGVGAEAAVLLPPGMMRAAREEEEEEKPERRAGGRGSGGEVSPAAGKSAWLLSLDAETTSLDLAMSIVAETCKPWDRLSPAWLLLTPRPHHVATAALAVAMAQPQVQERARVGLHVLPTIERRRDVRNRPYNLLVMKLIKFGPGAEPGAAAEAVGGEQQRQGGRRRAEEREVGPSPAAMAAAAAAAARATAGGEARLGGARRLW
ncbi:hypothetical protein Agub_g15277 [Astrephomene gubernaculifera]|uniref:Uncharacterized protein n=1 Tax=Astrephomene gubernaculifera TaxID=47775 RepID=A0AAD3E324_9CHLO|nr:hypothetical protein Agub_g15277 [Astrephomene gubernaculifera]